MTNELEAMDELLPCPFCGGEASGHPKFEDANNSRPGCYITCRSCDVSPEGCYRPADEWPEAVRIWNTRAAHTVMAAKVAEMERVLVAARQIIQADRDCTVECATLPPKHDLETLDAGARPYVEEYDQALSEIDTALGESRRQQ